RTMTLPGDCANHVSGPAWAGLALLVHRLLHDEGGWRRRVGRPLVGAVDGVVNLLPVHGHLLGGDDPQPDLVAADLDHRDGDVVVDHDAFVFFPGQYEHCFLSFSESWGLLIPTCSSHPAGGGGRDTSVKTTSPGESGEIVRGRAVRRPNDRYEPSAPQRLH